FSERTGLLARIDADADLQLGPETATALFRILQEALTNIARHACASSIAVRLQMDGDVVVLEVTDDGRGVTAGDQAKLSAFGLKGIAERVEGLSGSMTVGEPPNGGFQLTIRVPPMACEAGS